MTPGLSALAAVKLASLILFDPFEEYDFGCRLLRPNGDRLAAHGSFGGRSEETRTVTLASSVAGFPSERRAALKPLDRVQMASVQKPHGYVSYVFDWSMPFEHNSFQVTVFDVDFTKQDPARFSALGLCTKSVGKERPQ